MFHEFRLQPFVLVVSSELGCRTLFLNVTYPELYYSQQKYVSERVEVFFDQCLIQKHVMDAVYLEAKPI